MTNDRLRRWRSNVNSVIRCGADISAEISSSECAIVTWLLRLLATYENGNFVRIATISRSQLVGRWWCYLMLSYELLCAATFNSTRFESIWSLLQLWNSFRRLYFIRATIVLLGSWRVTYPPAFHYCGTIWLYVALQSWSGRLAWHEVKWHNMYNIVGSVLHTIKITN